VNTRIPRRQILGMAALVGASALDDAWSGTDAAAARTSVAMTQPGLKGRTTMPKQPLTVGDVTLHVGSTGGSDFIGGETQMSYMPLDPDDTLILFADLQTGIIELTATNDLARLRRAVAALAKLASLFIIPAIVTTAPAEGGPRVTPEIAASLGELPTHTRTTTDAFTHAPTRDAIVQTGRKTLLIAGVATEIIVQHSALSGAAGGFHVQVVVDACGGLSPRTEDAALRRLTQAGVVITSVASIAGQLAGDFTQPQGGKALGILYEFLSG